MSGVGRYENDDRPAKLRRLGRGPAQLTHSPLNTPQLSVSTDATLTLRTHGSDNTSDREEPNHAMEPRGSTLNVGEDLIGSATTAKKIIDALVRRGCSDLTLSIDLGACSDFPRGGGGFCDIYRGALRGGARIAIKSLRIYEGSEADGDSERRKILKRAARELYHWSKLQHPNVLPLMGLATFRGQISMISEWMDNGNLVSFLRLKPDADRNRLCMDVCEGLCHIHMKGMVHGDLKAANVVVSPRGIAMIADFGNAQLKDLTLKFSSTTKGGFSVRWTAPELLLTDSGPQVSKEADVYAYGMTVLEALTGKVPYEGINDHRIFILVAVEKKVPSRPAVNMSNGLWYLLNSCWAREPFKRPAITGVRDSLQALFWTSSDTESVKNSTSHSVLSSSKHKPEVLNTVDNAHRMPPSPPSVELIPATPVTTPEKPKFGFREFLPRQMAQQRAASPILSGSQPSKGSGSQDPPRQPALVIPSSPSTTVDPGASLFETSQPGLFPPPSLGLIPATPATPPTNQPKLGFQEILRQQVAQRRAASPLLSGSQPSDNSGFPPPGSLAVASLPPLSSFNLFPHIGGPRPALGAVPSGASNLGAYTSQSRSPPLSQWGAALPPALRASPAQGQGNFATVPLMNIPGINPGNIFGTPRLPDLNIGVGGSLWDNAVDPMLGGLQGVRRARSDGGNRRGHIQGARSEDVSGFRVPELGLQRFTMSDGSLAPPSMSVPSSFPLDLDEGGVGPRRRGRKQSDSGSHRASPHHSLNHSARELPDDNLSYGGIQLTKPVERVHFMTPATGEASSTRRTVQANFKCPVPGCGSTFSRHFNLRGHIRSHNEERPFKCKWPGCDTGFARLHDCKRHEALHLNIRPYTCEGCQKTFARMDALNRHLRSEGGTECQRVQSELTETHPPENSTRTDWQTGSGNIMV